MRRLFKGYCITIIPPQMNSKTAFEIPFIKSDVEGDRKMEVE